MRNRKKIRDWATGAAITTLLALLLPAVAAADTAADTEAAADTGWRLRFYAATVDFDNRRSSGYGYDVDVGGALAISAEYRFSRRLGVDIGGISGGGIGLTSRTASIGQTEFLVYDTLSFSALTGGLDIHLTPDQRADLYLCPMVALMVYGSIAVDGGRGFARTGLDFDEDLALGAALGVNAPFGARQKWSFSAQLTYLESTLDGTGGSRPWRAEDYETTMLGLGFGYRF